MRIHQVIRRLGKAGFGLLSAIALCSSFAIAGRAALTELPVVLEALVGRAAEKPPTRLDYVVSSAREIRAALAKPVVAPEPLAPITQKLAFGHLRQGSKAATAITVNARKRKPDPMAASGLSSLTYVDLR